MRSDHPLVSPDLPSLQNIDADNDAEIPIWNPEITSACPLPLPSPPPNATSGRPITVQQYKTLSLLLHVTDTKNQRYYHLDSNNNNDSIIPPVVGKVIGQKLQRSPNNQVSAPAAEDSDNVGVVTSHPHDDKKKSGDASMIETELESLLDQAMLQQGNKNHDNHVKHVGVEKKGQHIDDIGTTRSAQPPPLPSPPEIVTQITQSSGKNLTERVIAAALKTLGLGCWEDLIASTSPHNVATAKSAAVNGNRKLSSDSIPLADVLNPNSPFYHPEFTKAYRASKKALEKQDVAKRKAAALEEHSTLAPRWSSLTAREHTWYLQHEGQQLVGSDIERFNTLSAKVEAERREYWHAVHAAAMAHAHRYQHLTERQSAQMNTDLLLRKQRALGMPRLWYDRRIRGRQGPAPENYEYQIALPYLLKDGHVVEEGKGQQRVPFAISSQRTRLFPDPKELIRTGSPPSIRKLPKGTLIPGNKIYLPVQLGPAEHGAGPRSDVSTYRKEAVPELWNDPILEKCINDHYKDNPVVFCATAGAIQCIVRSALLGHTLPWLIPVTIKRRDDTTKRVIHIGKPFLKPKEMIREKQQRLQKYAVLSEALLMNHHEVSMTKRSQREAIYWTTQKPKVDSDSGDPLIIRSHGRVDIVSEKEDEKHREREGVDDLGGINGGEHLGNCTGIFAASAEYLPDPDQEEDGLEELITWWIKMQLNPGASTVTVAHVNVPQGRIVDWRTLAESDIAAALAESTVNVSAAKETLDTIFAYLGNLLGNSEGMYLMRHDAGGKVVHVLEESGLAQGSGSTDLPHAFPQELEELDPIFDLHKSQSMAGAVDSLADPYIPPKWRPYDAGIAQIPYTFPPLSLGRDQRGARRRQRKLHWTGDLDHVGHVATISRAEYENQLFEEL